MKTITSFIASSEKARNEIRKIGELYPEKQIVNIDIQEVERFDADLAKGILTDPAAEMKRWAEEITPDILSINAPVVATVAFYNLPPESSPHISMINQRHIGKLMRITGQVASVGATYPKQIRSLWVCNKCDEHMWVPQDGFQPAGVFIQPSRCKACGKSDFRRADTHSEYTTAQVILLTEQPEMLRAGESPPTLSVYLVGDLTFKDIDTMERISIDGQLRITPTGKKTDQQQMWYLDAHYVEKEIKSFEEISIDDDDIAKIKELSKQPHLIDRIAESFAITIYGHHEMKCALILQLIGGTEHLNEDGKRRHWINILALTDPGIGKSVLCQALVAISPKAVYAVGGGTTKGGLTSIAEHDVLTGTWMIKPGILPLAHGGVAALDEFTDLQEEEMNILKEAMEGGTVTSSKVGKNVRFKAETAIFACANPKAGKFDNYSNLLQQSGVPAPILSRFDLIFPMIDNVDLDKDEALAGAIMDLHMKKGKAAIIEKSLLKKYIGYAKKNYFPLPNDEVKKMFVDYYTALRKKGGQANLTSITPRQLESLVRLGEASAKLRLSHVVEKQDGELAIKLYEFCMSKIAMDSASGAFDTTTIHTGGQDKSHRQLTKSIATFIEECNDLVPLDAIIESSKPCTEFEVNQALEYLKQQGIIYEPRVGFYRTAHKPGGG